LKDEETATRTLTLHHCRNDFQDCAMRSDYE